MGELTADSSFQHIFSFQCFSCLNHIQVDGCDKPSAERIAASAAEEARRIEAKFSRYREDSIVSKINRQAAIGQFAVDEETGNLLDYADLAFRNSHGLFDITSGVLRRAWDFRNARLPSQAEIEALLPLVGWDRVEWVRPLLSLPIPGMEIDLGGIGKEYAVDRCAEIALQNGSRHTCINFGGDIRVTGPRANGRPWRIGVQHPRSGNAVLTVVPLEKGALATSGDYQRFFELEGTRYCHIINPRTGWPVNNLQSVTVISDTCIVSGSLATIAMLAGGSSAEAILNDAPLKYLLVDKHGVIHGNIFRP